MLGEQMDSKEQGDHRLAQVSGLGFRGAGNQVRGEL